MPPTLTRSLPPSTTTSPGRTAAGWAAAGVAALLGAVAAGEVLEPPGTVDLVVVNQADRDVTVVVSPAGGAGLPIATLDPGEERPVAGVLDRGDTWVVSFQVAGEPAGSTLELERSALEADGFRVTIPATEVGESDGEPVGEPGADAPDGATEG
jgi:hypothetical protein